MQSYDVVLVTDTPGWTYYSSVKRSWERGAGSHRLASHLRSYGYSVLVIDFSSYITFDIWTEICKNAISTNTKLLGFSTTWWPVRNTSTAYGDTKIFTAAVHSMKANEALFNYGETLTIAATNGNIHLWIDYAKNINPKLKIIVGGPKIASYFDVPADHFFVGFGETQIIDFLSQPKRIWPKIIDHDKEAKNKEFDFKYSSTSYTPESFIHPDETLQIEFSRGCRFKCSFCRYPMIGRKDIASYIKTPDLIYTELMNNYDNYGITRYNVLDDTLNDSSEKLEVIVNAVKKLPFKPKFWAYSRVDMIHTNPEQISLLQEMGLIETFMGIDTFHPVAARAINKGMSENKRKETLYKCKEVWGDNITIINGYIIGLPGEPKSHIESVAEWLKTPDCPVYFVPFSPLTLYNNNELTKYNPKSLMDLDPEKYGYTITNNEGFFAEWIKK